MEVERKPHPDCVNASNPFHQCGDHCLNRSRNPDLRINASSKSPVGNRAGVKSAVGSGGEVDVNPNCVNASNPFHRCGDHCSKKTVVSKKLNGTGKLVVNGDRARGKERNVDPTCVNASNPFHQCTDYCTKRVADAKTIRTSRIAAQNGELSNGATKMKVRNVNPSCTNASNPFHQCTEYCPQRTLGAKR